MEPPARLPHGTRRVFAAGRSFLARTPLGAGFLAALLLTASCSRPVGGLSEAGAGQGPDLALSDSTAVAPGDEGTFDDLPGVAGFDDLTVELQYQVVQRANRTRCDCGCPGHSVNHCLHQDEDCEVALRLAGSFVDDALSLQLQTRGPASAGPEDQPERESAQPEGLEESTDDGAL